MKILVSEKLSEHRYKTPEGYLICVDSILARTGKQTYRRNEIFTDSEDDRLIEVDRKAEEVFSPETMASFENKPICVEHPDVDVTVDNISEFAVGFVRDIHKGEYEGEPVMLGTLVITDAKTIEEIENGEHTDLSCGYDCDIEDCNSPEQKHIRGNHIALCEHGRAGIARIVDSACDANRLPAKVKRDLQKFLDHKSTFIRNKNYDIAEFVKEFERIAKVWAEFPVKVVRESIKGWFKTGDGMMRKDYTFSIEGYNDRFMVSLYAKPDTYETTELNAYFTDSIKDEQLYAVEFVYDGDSWSDYLGHVNVRAKSEQDALTKAKRWAVNRYDNACCFKIASTKYTNVETIDVLKDEESTYTEVTKNLEKEANKDMKWLDTVIGEKKKEIKDESNDFLNTSEHRRLIYEFMENNGNSFIISKEKNRLLKYIEKETGIKNADWHDVMYIIKNHTRAKLFDKEIKDYVPFPKKDALNKSNGLEEIKRIINNKDNTFEDTEGMIYLTEKAYNDIKVVIKIYGITQKELEGISRYFFGPGGYNMFR